LFIKILAHKSGKFFPTGYKAPVCARPACLE
jgi:hypothetical protein